MKCLMSLLIFLVIVTPPQTTSVNDQACPPAPPIRRILSRQVFNPHQLARWVDDFDLSREKD